jgi:Acetyltransferase (GNAT) domain
VADYGWIDFGFRLALPFWGKGLATEAASAWVERAFGELRMNRLTAIVHPENHAFINVLHKLGFRKERRAVSSATRDRDKCCWSVLKISSDVQIVWGRNPGYKAVTFELAEHAVNLGIEVGSPVTFFPGGMR